MPDENQVDQNQPEKEAIAEEQTQTEATAEEDSDAKAEAETKAELKAKQRGFQKRISRILEENLKEYQEFDALSTCFGDFVDKVNAEEDLAEYMREEPQSWVMLLHVISKYQMHHRLAAILQLKIGSDKITPDFVLKELRMIEQMQMKTMFEQYMQVAQMMKGLFGSKGQQGQGAGAAGPGGGILSAILGGEGGGGGAGIQVLTMEDLKGMGMSNVKARDEETPDVPTINELDNSVDPEKDVPN